MISPKMTLVMKYVLAGAAAGRGKEVTMDDLVSLAGAGSTKQAMQSTIRVLEARGFLERFYEVRSGKVVVFFLPTARGASLGRRS